MTKKSTFRGAVAAPGDGVDTVDTPPAPPQAGGEETKGLAEMLPEELLDAALSLQDEVADLIAKIADLEGALADSVGGAGPVSYTPLAGEIHGVDSMGVGERLHVPVEVRRKLGRPDLAAYGVGDQVALVTLAPGWDLPSLVDHVREGFCGAVK